MLLQSNNNTETIIYQARLLSQGNQNSCKKALLYKICLPYPFAQSKKMSKLAQNLHHKPQSRRPPLHSLPLCRATSKETEHREWRTLQLHQIPNSLRSQEQAEAYSNTSQQSSVPYPILSVRSCLSWAWHRPRYQCFTRLTTQHSSSISSSAISWPQSKGENLYQFFHKCF